MSVGDPTAAQNAQSALWTIASRATAVGGQMAFFLFVARLTGPQLIGAFALASALSFSLGRIASAGWEQYAIAHVNDAERIDQCWNAALFAAAVAAVCCLLIVAVSLIFELHPLFPWFLAALSPSVFFAPLYVVPVGMLIGRGELAKLAKLLIVADLAAAVAAVGALAAGAGIWTLVLHRLAMLGATLALVFWASRLRPKLKFAMPGKSLRQFFNTFFVSMVVYQVRMNAGLFLVGGLVGATSAGLFRTATRLSSAVSELSNEAIERMAWSQFTQPGNADQATKKGAEFTSVTFALTAPVFVGLALVADPAIVFFLGEKWVAAGAALAVLAIAGGMRIQVAGLVPALVGRGQLRDVIWLSLLPTAALFAAALLTARWGLMGITYSVLISEIVALAQRLWLGAKSNHVDLTMLFKGLIGPLAAVLAMAGAVLFFDQLVNFETSYSEIIQKTVLGVVVWMLASVLLQWPLMRSVVSAVAPNR